MAWAKDSAAAGSWSGETPITTIDSWRLANGVWSTDAVPWSQLYPAGDWPPTASVLGSWTVETPL